MVFSEEIDVLIDFSPELKIFKNGNIQRGSKPFIPASFEDQETSVSSKDISISNFSARIYLPKLESPENQKLPIQIYYHGGGFCIGSAFHSDYNRYINILTSQAKVITVSVEYRLAPEHPMPTSYEDSWISLQWVASHLDNEAKIEKEPWLINHGDFSKVFINGDSAGGNIVHVMAMKAGAEKLPKDMKILGVISAFPYFWSSEHEENVKGMNVIASFPYFWASKVEGKRKTLYYNLWDFIYPSANGGIDNPWVNPWAKNAPSLIGLGCSKMLVIVGEKDPGRETGIIYVEAVKKSGWKGDIELVDVQGGEHCFQFQNPDLEKSKDVIKRIVDFIKM